MLFKPNEKSEADLKIGKEDARTLVNQLGFEDYKYFDRFNLEALLNRFIRGNVTVFPDYNNQNANLKVGYAFNYCLPDAFVDRNVTENLLEVPLLREFLSRGCEIKFLGKSPIKFQKFAKGMEDFSGEWKKLPKPYQPIPSWIMDCVANYESKYEIELPDVDFVIMNAFPSFFFSNMMFYLISLHYARKGIPVFLWDIEFRTLRSKEADSMPKVFRYSGADKYFTEEEFELIAGNSYWLLQIPGEALSRVKQLNPRIRILPFFPPYWLKDDIGMFDLKQKTRFRISYIGNDSERRRTIKKYFTPLSKRNRLHLFGGGMSRRKEGYEDFDNYVGDIKMHGAIPQDQVWRTYNLSRTCLSVARQRYYNVGFIVHRWFETVLGGSILLLPSELYGVEKYFNSSFLVSDVEELEEKINFFNDKIKMNKLRAVHLWQKKLIYRLFSSEKGVDTIFRTIGK
jgi:hypothetical protein